MPLGLVMTRVEPELTATKRPLPYATLHQPLLAEARIVQVIPSGLVMTLFPEPLLATATNSPFPYVTLVHELSAALVRIVHVMQSGDVMTRLPVPVEETATKSPFPYVTPVH